MMMSNSFLMGGLLALTLLPGQLMAQQTSPKDDPEFLKKSALMIDRHVAALYKSKKLEVPEVVDDPTFLRRSFIVAAGRIPNLEEARAFLEIEDADKREALVAYLMQSDGYRSQMTNWVFDLLRLQEQWYGARDRSTSVMSSMSMILFPRICLGTNSRNRSSPQKVQLGWKVMGPLVTSFAIKAWS